jgi:hypothetical protein
MEIYSFTVPHVLLVLSTDWPQISGVNPFVETDWGVDMMGWSVQLGDMKRERVAWIAAPPVILWNKRQVFREWAGYRDFK